MSRLRPFGNGASSPPLRFGIGGGRILGEGDPADARFSGLAITALGVVSLGTAGIVLSYAWWALVVAAGFLWGDWADKAATMMAERADAPD